MRPMMATRSKSRRGRTPGARTKLSTTTGYTYTQVMLVDGKSVSRQGGYAIGADEFGAMKNHVTDIYH